MTEMVRAEAVSFRYPEEDWPAAEGRRQVLHEICLQIRPGELVALVGANGSGKSTLARHLNALLPLQQGRLYVCGLDAADPRQWHALRQRCGMVFQDPDNQFVAGQVGEDVAFGLENFNWPAQKIAPRVAEVLTQVGLAGFAPRAIDTLSGGQKQRAALAAALAPGPQLIVLDEATAMLDPAGRQQVLDVLLRLRRQGTTLLLVTHLAAEAALADRVCLLSRGRVLAFAPPREVFADAALLAEAGVEAPLAGRLSHDLARAGLRLPFFPLQEAELAQAFCQARAQQAAAVPPAAAELPSAVSLSDAAPDNTAPEGAALPLTATAQRAGENMLETAVGKARADAAAENGTDDAPVLTLRQVVYRYPMPDSCCQPALDSVSVSFRRGEFAAIAGRTGCGKSTLLQIAAGLLPPQRGQVLCAGVPPVPGAPGMPAIVFQSAEQQLFAASVEEEIAFALRRLRLTAAERRARVRRALAAVGAPASWLPLSPFSLSGGEQRLVAIAAVLVMEPAILLLDEPTAGLDCRFRQQLLARLAALTANGVTVVMASHDMEALAEYASRLLLLDAGRLVFDLPIERAFANPDLLAAHGVAVGPAQAAASALRAAGCALPDGLLRYAQLHAAVLAAWTAGGEGGDVDALR